jgi:hypothetical protein
VSSSTSDVNSDDQSHPRVCSVPSVSPNT